MRPRPTLMYLLLAVPLMAAAPEGSKIAHGGNGHGAPACAICHGSKFRGNAALRAPALAGLPETTILAKLAHYAGPHGHNIMMRQVATSLSATERQAVATYLSSLPPAR